MKEVVMLRINPAKSCNISLESEMSAKSKVCNEAFTGVCCAAEGTDDKAQVDLDTERGVHEKGGEPLEGGGEVETEDLEKAQLQLCFARLAALCAKSALEASSCESSGAAARVAARAKCAGCPLSSLCLEWRCKDLTMSLTRGTK